MGKVTVYATNTAQIPSAYLSLDVARDTGGTSVGWQAVLCTRCGVRFQEHVWVLYADNSSIDCSEDPR